MMKRTFTFSFVFVALMAVATMAVAAPKSGADTPQSKIIKHQTDLCLAQAGDARAKASCYIDGYTSAIMLIKQLNESLTEKFPPNFVPWADSIKLWNSYQNNENKVMEQVFAPGKNPRLTIGGARSVYIVGIARLKVLEGYSSGLRK